MKEVKKCKICGKILSDRNKSGYCISHLPRSGANNPFFGKKHKKEVIEKMKKKCSEASKKLWKNDEYRNLVISNTTGKKRNDEFKEKQRLNALKQFKDKHQREIRSEKMKESWENGNIVMIDKPSTNRSKQEIKFYLALKEKYIENDLLTEKCISYIDKYGKKKWLFPDIIIKDKNIIIEYNGSFWHANPSKFNENDIVHHNVSAKDIWERDKEKNDIYQKLGYKEIIVWSDDFIKNKDECIKKVINEINNV